MSNVQDILYLEEYRNVSLSSISEILPLLTLKPEDAQGVPSAVEASWAKLGSVTGYEVEDSGHPIEKLKFVCDSMVYFYDLGRQGDFLSIRIQGADEIGNCEKLRALYEAGMPVTLIDLYGVVRSHCFITLFNSEFIRARGAYGFNIELVQMPDVSQWINTGGAAGMKLYGFEVCTVTDRGGRVEAKESSSGEIYWDVKTYTNRLYDVMLSGMEYVNPSNGNGAYTDDVETGVFTLTLPNGKQYKAVITNKTYTLIQGTSRFRKFDVQLIASADLDIKIAGEDAIVESWQKTFVGARWSRHETIGGTIVQKFAAQDDTDMSITYLTNEPEEYAIGTEVSFNEDTFTYEGLLINKQEAGVEGSATTRRVTLSLISVPS